ncbi:MAG TPA: L,D-transpeptidase [Minicystis sp.]|nr:L,D-transpeptidase [Minicystis sp.]
METRTRRLGGAGASIVLAIALGATGCKGKLAGEALAKAEPNDAYANVPPPPVDGPKLVALREVAVKARPSAASPTIGTLDLGSVVARSREPIARGACDGGWYVVRPRGFVCADAGLVLDERAARLAPAPPNLERALPFRYARAKVDNVPLYARVPTTAEQIEAEPDLARHAPKPLDADPLGASANDVPLDAHLAASGPPVLLPTGEGIEGGRRTAASFFAFPSEAVAPLLPVSGALGGVKTAGLRKGSGVALAGAFAADGRGGVRRFGVTPAGLVVPLDRLKPSLGTTFHGIELEGVGLPVAFVHHAGVHAYSMQHGKALRGDDELERRAVVPLTGKFRTVDGVRYDEARDGSWLRAKDLVLVVRRSKFPDFARGNQRWLDVSIANQTLTAYEGHKPIYATLVSTGRDQLKDPATSASTPRGELRVTAKRVRRALDPREGGGGFDVGDAPWVLELDGGTDIAGAYWTDGFGEAQTYHDVVLAPIDAHRVWAWATPELPDGWAAATAAAGGATTIVNVRP